MVDNQFGLDIHNLESARSYLAQAEQAREQGDFAVALEKSDLALLASQAQQDTATSAEILASRFRVFKHLYAQSKDQAYSILAKHTALAALELAKVSGNSDALAFAYISLGGYYVEVEDYSQSAQHYQFALEHIQSNQNSLLNRPSVLADISGHLYFAQYFAGDASALDKALQALEDLKNAQEESFNKIVWITGAQLRIAQMYLSTGLTGDAQKANLHLDEVRTAVQQDDRLILRKKQLEEFEKTHFEQ